MRLADALVDLAAVLGASRSVAAKHVALRARQLDRYGKTSSVVASLRGVGGEGGGGRSQWQQSQQQYERPGSGSARGGESDERAATSSSDAAASTTAAGAAETSNGSGTGSGKSHDVQRTAESQSQSQSESESEVTDLPAGFPSMRVGGLKPRSAPVGAAAATTRNDPSSTSSGKSDFVPAPWAAGGPVHRQTPVRRPPPHPRQGLPSAAANMPVMPKAGSSSTGEESADAVAAAGIDFNVFRTVRGSRILETLGERGGDKDRLPSSGETVPKEEKEEEERKVSETSEVSEAKSAEESPERSNESLSVENKATTMAESQPESTLSADGTSIPPIERGEGDKPSETISEEKAAETPSEASPSSPASSPPAYELRESRVPSSRLGRIWNYGGLAAGMFAGAMGESFSRAFSGSDGKNQGSVMLNPANMERLVAKLSRMRGAALKLGQMMSFQDSKVLPGPIQEVLQRVQDRADYMPAWQRDRVLGANLGADWRELFGEFDEKPIAAASIGQVHRATLRSSGARVAVKIQFPGVADSINSDLDNLGMLLAATRLLPKGLYLDKTIANARTELAWECDYVREAECAQRYRELLADEPAVFAVPEIYPEACGPQVLTMEFMDGVGVTRALNQSQNLNLNLNQNQNKEPLTQEQRDWIGTQILRLCLREIAEFRFMQTDPNWTNFLYNAARHRLELLDFGASRAFPDEFISLYVRVLEAASRGDRAAVRDLSEQLGYLTGHESRAMVDAHVTSVLTLAEPFLDSAPEVYDFRDQTITERVKAQIPVMIRERLAPPPEETYSLHRKLSGAFLLCARLGSRVPCRELFRQALEKTGNAV